MSLFKHFRIIKSGNTYCQKIFIFFAGHKISNFFKNLGRKKAPEENGETLEEEEEDENESSPSKQKKQVRFFGRNKNKAEAATEESKKEESSKENDNSEASDKDEEASDEEKSEDEDEVSSIEEEPIKEETKKAKKHVTINEDIKSDSDQKSSPSNQRKKSRACSIL